jgi:hypothetical protein
LSCDGFARITFSFVPRQIAIPAINWAVPQPNLPHEICWNESSALSRSSHSSTCPRLDTVAISGHFEKNSCGFSGLNGALRGDVPRRQSPQNMIWTSR